MKYKYLLLLLLMLPFVSGCNDSDDVNGIFTGKVWKLTYITKKNEHKPYDFWGDKDKYEQSIKNYINKEGAYTIKFELEKIFERFEKVDSFAQGVGLGLSICKSIVDKMNGRIQVYSQLGLGTTFIAELPCHSILVNE